MTARLKPNTCAPFSYSERGQTPQGYVCAECGAQGVRLYRDYNTMVSHQTLRCRKCARDQYTSTDLKRWESYKSPNDKEHCIGGVVAAVPTEDGTTYWGYTSVSQAGVEWWDALPKMKIDP